MLARMRLSVNYVQRSFTGHRKPISSLTKPDPTLPPLYTTKRAFKASTRPSYSTSLTVLHGHNSGQVTDPLVNVPPTEPTSEAVSTVIPDSALQPAPSHHDVVLTSTAGISDELSSAVSFPQSGGAFVRDRFVKNLQLLRRWIGKRDLVPTALLKSPVEVLKVLETLPKGSVLSSDQENDVLDLLRSEERPPRQMLTFIAKGIRNVSQEHAKNYPTWAHLVLPVLKAAWNNGKDDADPQAALLMLGARNCEVKPPENLISLSEAAAIAEVVGSQWPELASTAKFYISIRQFEYSTVEEQNALRLGILDFLHKEWEETKNTWAGYWLARLYVKGFIVPHDTEMGKMWMLRVAEQGHPQTAFEVGMKYSGMKVPLAPNRLVISLAISSLPINHAEAHRFLEIASKGGMGRTRLAQYYYLDPTSPFPTVEEHRAHWGVDPDDQRAFELFTKGSKENPVFARKKLAEMKALNRFPAGIVDETKLLRQKKRERRKLDAATKMLANSATAASSQERRKGYEGPSQELVMASDSTNLPLPSCEPLSVPPNSTTAVSLDENSQGGADGTPEVAMMAEQDDLFPAALAVVEGTPELETERETDRPETTIVSNSIELSHTAILASESKEVDKST